MEVPRKVWVRLNCVRLGWACTNNLLHKMQLADMDKCVCGTTQTVDHITNDCPVYKAPPGIDLNIINEELLKWLNSDIPLWQIVYIVNLHTKEEVQAVNIFPVLFMATRYFQKKKVQCVILKKSLCLYVYECFCGWMNVEKLIIIIIIKKIKLWKNNVLAKNVGKKSLWFLIEKKSLENHLNEKHYRHFEMQKKKHSQFEIKIKKFL
jgi:hypothetical protein